MDGKTKAEQYEQQMAYVDQLRSGLTVAVYRFGTPWYDLRQCGKLRRPKTWQDIPGVSKLYSLN